MQGAIVIYSFTPSFEEYSFEISRSKRNGQRWFSFGKGEGRSSHYECYALLVSKKEFESIDSCEDLNESIKNIKERAVKLDD